MASTPSSLSSGLSFTEELNNKAVLRLHEGKYEEAIKILACALHSTKRDMDNTSMEGQEEQMRPSPADLDDFIKQSPVISCGNDLVQQERQGQTVYVYHRAIVIPSFCKKQNGFPQQESRSTLCGTIVILNLALSYHLGSKISLAKRRVYLQKAAKLYNLAYNLHIEEKLNSTLFAMATINNLGLVNDELDHPERSRKCFRHVLSTVMCLIDRGQYILSEHEGFIHNASIFILQTENAAATA